MSIKRFIDFMISDTRPARLSPLPNELWIRILEEASRPTKFIGDENCSPDEIESSLMIRQATETADKARRLYKQNKRRLRAVCRLWRDIVDAMKEIEWVLDVRMAGRWKTRLEEVGPGDPNGTMHFPRVNLLWTGSRPLEIQHGHPISSLTLVVWTDMSRNEYGWLEGVSSLIPHLTCLRSLHLDFSNMATLSTSFLSPLAQPDVPLITFSLKTSQEGIVNVPLVFPYLTTLSVYIPANLGSQNASEGTSWDLPSLINLSFHNMSTARVKTKGYFLSALLEKHSTQLRSLRATNVRYSGIDMSSVSFWAALPKLEVFATDFTAFMYDTFDRPLKGQAMHDAFRVAWPAASSLRHLIQNGSSFPSVFLPGLTKAIEYCPKLDTLSFCAASGSPFGYYWTLSLMERAAAWKIERICASRGIRILDEDGSPLTNILKPYA